jgi:hypothetical protein
MSTAGQAKATRALDRIRPPNHCSSTRRFASVGLSRRKQSASTVTIVQRIVPTVIRAANSADVVCMAAGYRSKLDDRFKLSVNLWLPCRRHGVLHYLAPTTSLCVSTPPTDTTNWYYWLCRCTPDGIDDRLHAGVHSRQRSRRSKSSTGFYAASRTPWIRLGRRDRTSAGQSRQREPRPR